MMVSTKGRYALRVMLDLAEYGHGGHVSLADISARQEISLKYLEAIVAALSKAASSKAGAAKREDIVWQGRQRIHGRLDFESGGGKPCPRFLSRGRNGALQTLATLSHFARLEGT